MSKEINNDYPFASAAVDNGYHAQHRLKEATMTGTRIRRRWLAEFIVACICAFAAVTLAQSADPTSEQRAAGEPSSDMPLIAPTGNGFGKYVDLAASSQGPAIDEKAAPIFVKKVPPGYRDWRLISVAHEEGDLNDIRAILGNDIAIKAYREGKLPFPDGTIIARLAWSYDPSEENNKVFGRAQSFVAGHAQERRSVYGQGLKKIRLDRRLGVRSIRRRQACRRGRCSTPAFPATQAIKASRLRLHPLRTLTLVERSHSTSLTFDLGERMGGKHGKSHSGHRRGGPRRRDRAHGHRTAVEARQSGACDGAK